MNIKNLALFYTLLFFVFIGQIIGSDLRVVSAENSSVSGNLDGPGFAVVELFTSQGCSSCPPADRLLEKIKIEATKNNLRIFPLSFHVDYWNYLGWQDPHSADFATLRQRNYSKIFKRRGVYTPQAIVNGSKQFVGSNKKDFQTAVQSALSKKDKFSAEFNAQKFEGQNLEISYKLNSKKENLDLIVVEYMKNTNNFVPKGENSGSTLSHTNVVKSLKKFRLDSTVTGVVRYQIDQTSKKPLNSTGLLAILQDRVTLEIVLAKPLRISKF